MNHDIFYFSGSGNSLHIARTVSAAAPGRIRAIGALDPSENVRTDADMVGLVFPVYFMDCPDILAAFIGRLEVKPDATMCVSCQQEVERLSRRNRPQRQIEW